MKSFVVCAALACAAPAVAQDAQEAEMLRSYAATFARIHAAQQAKNGGKQHLRGMHAKGHGWIQGEMEVTTDDAVLKHGLFKEKRRYQAVARFSNGSGLVQSDAQRDLRGLAVKLAIGAEPQVPEALEPGVHDLLMTNAPAHHARNITELMEFIEAQAEGGFTFAAFMVTHPRMALTLIRQTGRTVDSLANETYWSRSPYRLGDALTMKYAARPCMTLKPRAIAQGDDEAVRLSQDIDYQLEKQGLCFDVVIQLQTDPEKEPVEDHAVEWLSPQQVVARLTFPEQKVQRDETCENLVFNPWNAHAEHRPLGNLNRARLPIYRAAAEYRRTPD